MFGRTSLGQVGSSVSIFASSDGHEKVGGVTVDWTTVAAVAGADVTLNDGQIVKIGDKYLRYGQLLTRITATGFFGPYDPAAADGRQLLVRGDAWIVVRTVVNTDPKADYPPVADGGTVFLARLIQSGVAAHTLALGPTLAELTALFPLLQFASV